jgi:hypothetical protein
MRRMPRLQLVLLALNGLFLGLAIWGAVGATPGEGGIGAGLAAMAAIVTGCRSRTPSCSRSSGCRGSRRRRRCSRSSSWPATSTFDPVLPDDRLTLYRHSTAGPETKTLLVYDEPFWRTAGLSGQSAGPQSASEVTLDASSAAGKLGVIASFTFGPIAERVDALDACERRRQVIAAMVERFGPRASSPSAFIETPWWKEPWTRGCSMAHWSPGILTKYGSLLRRPFGRVHWAGTETATISYGAIDAAVAPASVPPRRSWPPCRRPTAPRTN